MTRPNPFRAAINAIGTLLFDRAFGGDFDMTLKCRRQDDATVIVITHTDAGTMRFVFTDADVDAAMTPRQRAARDVLRAARPQGKPH